MKRKALLKFIVALIVALLMDITLVMGSWAIFSDELNVWSVLTELFVVCVTVHMNKLLYDNYKAWRDFK